MLNREIVSFRSCVRAYARSGCLVELDRKEGRVYFPFFRYGVPNFRFPFLGATSYPNSLLPTPQTSYRILVGLICITLYFLANYFKIEQIRHN